MYAPNSYDGPQADPSLIAEPLWYADGEMVRSAYTLREDDDDWSQAGTMVSQVLDDAARDRLVSNVVGHLLKGVSEPVLARAFDYWRNVDKDLGDRIEQGLRSQRPGTAPKGAEPSGEVGRNGAVGDVRP